MQNRKPIQIDLRLQIEMESYEKKEKYRCLCELTISRSSTLKENFYQPEIKLVQ